MAQHGYLHDSYDSDDFGRGDDREREWRDRERGEWRDRDRGFMFDERDRHRPRDEDGFFGRMGENARDLFRDDERDIAHRSDRYGRSQSRSEFGRSDRESSSGRRFSATTDDHYRSWRDRQLQALDRDYEDYCREREQQFHQDFDSWRSQRRGNQEPLRTGMTQTASAGEPSGTLELTSETQSGALDAADPSGGTAGVAPSGRGRK